MCHDLHGGQDNCGVHSLLELYVDSWDRPQVTRLVLQMTLSAGCLAALPLLFFLERRWLNQALCVVGKYSFIELYSQLDWFSNFISLFITERCVPQGNSMIINLHFSFISSRTVCFKVMLLDAQKLIASVLSSGGGGRGRDKITNLWLYLSSKLGLWI